LTYLNILDWSEADGVTKSNFLQFSQKALDSRQERTDAGL